MKEKKYFNCKSKGHIILNYPKNSKISAITYISNVNNIKINNKEKK